MPLTPLLPSYTPPFSTGTMAGDEVDGVSRDPRVSYIIKSARSLCNASFRCSDSNGDSPSTNKMDPFESLRAVAAVDKFLNDTRYVRKGRLVR